jgi:hypothetical protein
LSLPRGAVGAFPYQRMAWGPACDDTCGFMRRMLVVLVWVVATAGVTYVANAAVELVDLQVFPQGARIEVLARATPAPTTLVPVRVTTAPPVATTTVAVPVATVVATTTTSATATTTVVVAPTVAPTTTVAAAPTTTLVGAPATTTTAPVATTRPPTTTTRPPMTTMMLPALAMADSVLDGGRTGVAYRTRLVMDGSAPFVWEVETGGLPAGLVLTGDGYLEGTPTGSGNYVFTATVLGESGRAGTVEYSIVVREFRIVSSRGGSVTVIVQGNSVAFFSALQAEGFDQAVLVRGGPIVVEVQFLPSGGYETSWVRCEAADGVVCSNG